MKPSTLGFSVLVASAVVTAPGRLLAQAPPPGSGTVTITGPVRVIEADTLEVIINGRRVGVGIAGIVAPAGNTACGRQAIQFAQSLVNQRLELQEDPGVPAFDPAYRRMYRVVRQPAGSSVAVALASAGFARADQNAQQAVDFAAILNAIADAKANARGCVR